MPLPDWRIALALAAGLALFAAGCGGSNNKGKIAGKWKITGGGGSWKTN